MHIHLPHSWQAEVTEYYVFVTMWMMGNYGSNILLPLYLLDNGYSLAHIIILCLINEAALVFFLFLSSMVMKRWGFRIILGLGIMLFTAFLMLLVFLETTAGMIDMFWFLGLIFVVRGLGKAFLNFGHEVFMIKVATRKKGGSVISWFRICMIVASVMTPAVMGLAAYVFGYDIAFLALATLSAASMIPLLMIPNHQFQINYRPKGLVPLMRTRIKKRYLLAEVGRSFADGVLFIMWPVFVFLAVGNVKDVGLITSASAFLSIIVAYLIGRMLNDRRRKKSDTVFRIGVRMSAFMYVLRSAFPTPLLLTIVDACNRICESVVQVNFETRCYRYLKSMSDQDKIETANVRCLMIEGVYILALFYMLSIVMMFQQPSTLMFAVTFSFSALTILLMTQIIAVRCPVPSVQKPRWWQWWKQEC